MDLAELAGQLYDAFEQRSRNFTTLKDDAPEWIRDLVYAAHGDFGPDDYRYNAIQDAAGYMHDNPSEDPEEGSHDFADSNVDVYNADRYRWLASNLNRASYVDEATEEFGPAENVTDAIGRGQYMELQEIYSSVLSSLHDHLEQMEEEEEEEGADA